MQRVVFAKFQEEFFGEAGLKSFADFYDYPGGTRIGENERRNVYKLTFGEGPDAKVLYIKRFKKPHLKDVLSARHNFGRLTSQAEVEWGNANLLLQNGIDTYKPACMGERTICGFESKSFIITEQLKSTCLLDFVITKWHTLERARQDRIVIAMAQLARRAHQVNISLQDLYIWHIFIDEDSLEDDCRMSVIDLHRMLRNIENPNKKIMDMAALYWSLSSDYFDDGHKDLLVATYTDEGWAGGKEEILEKIRKREKVLDSRRILRNHYEKAKTGLA
ncbi:MAG: hypothetical protein JXN61_11220 [Sedimentisphaerales bacterium]|nr:hypothetical protein [Sedimentisphaerales bacterium]